MTLKVLELFSGIGGMHFACKEAERLTSSSLQFDIVAAADINTSANSVYKTNFPDTKLMAYNIQDMKVEDLNSLQPDVILMSPPCQPFTRTGLKKDVCDPRCSALSHLTNVIPSITSLQYILLENVKGFELSQSRQAFVEMLSSNGFNYVECLLSPAQFGVPNSRTRYYLIAKKCTEDRQQSRKFGFAYRDGELITQVPQLLTNSPLQVTSFSPLISNMTLLSILDTIDVENTLYIKYRVSIKDLMKRFNVLDIVNTGCSSTNCFTSAYTRYAEGTGSVLSSLEDMDTIEQIINQAKQLVLQKQQEKTKDGMDSNPDGESIAKRIKLDSEDTKTIEKGSEEERSGKGKTRKLDNADKDLETNNTVVSELQNELPCDKQKTESKNVVENIEKAAGNDNLELEHDEHISSACKDVEKSFIDHETQMENNDEDMETSTNVDKLGKKKVLDNFIEKSTPDSKRQAENNVKEVKTATSDGNKEARKTPNKETKKSHLENVHDTGDLLELLQRLNLRYFSPNEIRKLMCFPEEFKFPDTCSDKSRYKLLGNSINVHVVAYCICLMLS
uniref:tRNA (Cytosine(38)-C(5))-methyltransferase n=1 Tax=Cacopsylla melanoneura TaxID=428564 RepID=A0A8D9F270_9HEMI